MVSDAAVLCLRFKSWRMAGGSAIKALKVRIALAVIAIVPSVEMLVEIVSSRGILAGTPAKSGRRHFVSIAR